MTVLLSPAAIAERRAVVRGSLAPLAASIRDDLAPLLAAGDVPWIPPDKARMTRLGGRCPVHGALLEFDPGSPHAHRCPACGAIYREDEHYRWWVMNYQLWLAERAVHAAALHALLDDDACGSLAAGILQTLAARYTDYPNRDNVLGPTRPFFSTYLESIWLLQLTVALDLLEARDGRTALGDEVRERLIRPSVALIASYDEGWSNRQVYNNAAMAAAGALLDAPELVDRAVRGPSGLEAHFARALLADGTWYEGENYHLFAHRGLWYGVAIAEAHGYALSDEGRRRFGEAFATPFATALPDFTFPSRRDSQYRVSLRQWRMAESCELGFARTGDDRLAGALAELYRSDVSSGATGRATSTAEAERNVPPVQLTRASVGWKSLLFALPSLPPLAPLAGWRPESVHLAGQGLAVLRRNDARTFVALDYGESGGGHGHPDRLNLWLVVGPSRVLEDVGTGSYVDPTLHWYRSTLAHNAPLADGRSQWRTAGELTAYDERPAQDAGLVSARATIAPGVEVERTVVVMGDYLVDEVRWTADRVITFDLPFHIDADVLSGGRWRSAALAGGQGREDGFDFIARSEHVTATPGLSFHSRVGELAVRAWVAGDAPHEWWRCAAPGPPGEPRRRFLMLRARARGGMLRSVWSWGARVTACAFDHAGVGVQRGTGAHDRHHRDVEAWYVTRHRRTEETTITLDASNGDRDRLRPDGVAEPRIPPARTVASDGADRESTPAQRIETGSEAPAALGEIAGPPSGTAEHARTGSALPALRFKLGRAHYRRSEQSWEEAGHPQASVGLMATPTDLVVEVAVRDATACFAPARADNPLDNEHPDVNSDGIQLYLGHALGTARYYAWLLVPEPAEAAQAAEAAHAADAADAADAFITAKSARGPALRVRVSQRAEFGPPVPLVARARLTPGEGWVVRAVLPRAALLPGGSGDFTLDLIVNEITPDRERRRGQLVLSGGRDEWIYLRGDRQDAARALTFRVTDD